MKKIIIYFIVLLIFIVGMSSFNSSMFSTSEVTYNEFLQMIDEGKIESVSIGETQIDIKLIDDNKTYYTGYVEYDQLVNKLYDAGIDFSKAPTSNSSTFISIIITLAINILPFVLIIWFYLKIFSPKGGSDNNSGGPGGIFTIGKSKAKLNINKDTGVTFDDVAGQDEAKEQLAEIIDFLHNPQKYKDIGAKIPKGALLVGPPGTGKTLLARAVAGEAKVPFFSTSGSEFVEMYVGVGAQRVRDLFNQAKQHAPCIIFIDEVDAIAKSRDSGLGSNDERDQTLNQLLMEMDGFDSADGIIILAATNRPENLDKAFLRAGRFDRKVIVERPDFKGRVDTLKVHSKKVKLDDSVDLKAIAYATTGSVGADLENIVNEAALNAVRMGRKSVSQADLMEAVETVFAGKEKKDRIMSEKEKSLVAYHEVGHAVVAAMQKNTSPVQKITIVPRTKGSLGYTMQIPEEEKYLSTKEEILEDITTFLGGRSAEEVIFNTITTGASNDIERATALARQMVTMYGMSDKFDMVALESIQNRYLDGKAVRNCSSETATLIDNEVQNIITECHNKARKIIEDNRDLMDAVANYLIRKESITGEEFMDIFNEYHPEMELKITTIEDLDKGNNKEEPLHSEPEDYEEEIPLVIVSDNKSENKTISVPVITEKQEHTEDKKEEPKKEIPIIIAEDTSQKVDADEDSTQEESVKKEPLKNEEPIKIDRPSASVLGPQEGKKKKKKNKSKASTADMKNLIESVQKQSKEQPKTEEMPIEEKTPNAKKAEENTSNIDDIPAESAGTSSGKTDINDYANNKEDMDDITEDMF